MQNADERFSRCVDSGVHKLKGTVIGTYCASLRVNDAQFASHPHSFSVPTVPSLMYLLLCG